MRLRKLSHAGERQSRTGPCCACRSDLSSAARRSELAETIPSVLRCWSRRTAGPGSNGSPVEESTCHRSAKRRTLWHSKDKTPPVPTGRPTPRSSRTMRALGSAFDTDRRRAHIDHHPAQPRSMQMLPAQNALAARTHTARAGVKPRPALVAVYGEDGPVKDAKAEHRRCRLVLVYR